MNIFQKIAANFIGLKIALAVDKSIRQFPNIDKGVIHTYLSRKDIWSPELYRDIKKRIIDGFDKKVSIYELDRLGDKYLSFFREIFPEDEGQEIKEKIKKGRVEFFAQKMIDSNRSLSPDGVDEIVSKSLEMGIDDFNTVEKVKTKFEYNILNWELQNGIFPNYESDFILQKDEQCIYKNRSAELLERKQITTRVNYAGPRVRMNIMKGVSYSVGSYNVSQEKETVNQSKGTGTLNLTTKRILFKNNDKNLTIPLKSIIDIEPFSDAVKIIRSSGNPLIFKVFDGVRLSQYLNGAIGFLNSGGRGQVESQSGVQFIVTTSEPKRTKEEIQEELEYQNKYPKWTSSQKTLGQCFRANRIEPLKVGTTEMVYYKTDRFAELFGRGKDCSYFPGYGQIFNRKFKIWYQEYNSNDIQGLREYFDIATEYQAPIFADEISDGHRIHNELERRKGYKRLFNVRVDRTRRTWYAGLEELEFTGIITDGERETD